VCDFETGAGVEECVEKASKGEYLEGNKNLKLVVNCTALSQPKQCEENEEKARKINAPTHLCEALMSKYGKGSEERVPLLVHMSTDQVFCGSYSNTREDDAREKAFEPINAYGRSKKYAESYLLENYDKNALVILRSSVITGPQPPYRRVDRPLFLDFIAKTCPPNTRGQSAEGEEKEEVKDENAVEFWTDEFRNPVSRIDLTEAIVYCFEIFVGLRRKRDVSAFLFEEGGGSSDSTPIYHAGGPERLSRYDMVTIFCNTMRASKKRAKPAEKSKTTSSSAAAVVKTPADISMDSTKFMTVLRNGVQLKSFQEQVLDSTTVYLSAVLGKTR
jgi:dTDP-4-dehydrorhamnose reductase